MTTSQHDENHRPDDNTGGNTNGVKLSAAETENKPRKIGCLTYLWVGGVFVVVLVWFNIFRSVPLRVSPETTHITEPLSADGRVVDYIAAVEQKMYPPEMQTDDNGFRMIFREIGPIERLSPDGLQQHYEKLGLDMINDKPTLPFSDGYEYFKRLYERSPEEFDDILEHSHELRREQIEKEMARIDEIFGDNADTENVENGDAPAEPRLETFNSYDAWKETARYPGMHELPMVRRWLEENDAALNLIVEASKKPVFVPPIVVPKESPCLFAVLLPTLYDVRCFARGLENRATIRVSAGDIDGAIEDILACHRLGRHLSKYAFLVGQLVGIACEGIAHDVAYNGNLLAQADAEQLKRLRDGLIDLPPRGTWEEVMEFERLGMLDMTRMIMQDPGEANDVFVSLGMDKRSTTFLATLARSGMDWNAVFREVNETFDDAIAGTFTHKHPSLNPLRYLSLQPRSKEFGQVIIELFLPASDAAREAMRRLQCLDNIKRVQLAMFLYHAEHGTLPPAFTVDENGRKLHSWHVLLLPYLGDEAAAELHAQIRLDEPWDSEHNRQFHETNVELYQCPSAAGSVGPGANKDGDSNYSVIVGDDLLFGNDGKGRSLDGFGPRMFLVVERREGICWMNPDADMTQTVAETGIVNKGAASTGGYHTGGCNVAMRDGSVLFISDTTDPDRFIEQVRGTAKE